MKYRPHEFADIAGVSVKTLHRWDSSGKLRSQRTIGVIYCRVSSSAQKPELQNQVEAMKQFCTEVPPYKRGGYTSRRSQVPPMF